MEKKQKAEMDPVTKELDKLRAEKAPAGKLQEAVDRQQALLKKHTAQLDGLLKDLPLIHHRWYSDIISTQRTFQAPIPKNPSRATPTTK